MGREICKITGHDCCNCEPDCEEKYASKESVYLIVEEYNDYTDIVIGYRNREDAEAHEKELIDANAKLEEGKIIESGKVRIAKVEII